MCVYSERPWFMVSSFSFAAIRPQIPTPGHSSLVRGLKVRSVSRGRSTQIEGRERCRVELGRCTDRDPSRWMLTPNSMQDCKKFMWLTGQSAAPPATPPESARPWSSRTARSRPLGASLDTPPMPHSSAPVRASPLSMSFPPNWACSPFFLSYPTGQMQSTSNWAIPAHGLDWDLI